MPSLIQDIITKHSEVLTSAHRKLLARDITDHYKMFGNIGADFDTRDWLAFRDWLLSESVDNKTNAAILSAGGNHE
jgi:hypothetical protein